MIIGLIGTAYGYFSVQHTQNKRLAKDLKKTNGIILNKKMLPVIETGHGSGEIYYYTIIEFKDEYGIKHQFIDKNNYNKIGDTVRLMYSKNDPSIAFLKNPVEFTSALKKAIKEMSAFITIVGLFFIGIDVFRRKYLKKLHKGMTVNEFLQSTKQKRA